MNFPDEFSHNIIKTRFGFLFEARALGLKFEIKDLHLVKMDLNDWVCRDNNNEGRVIIVFQSPEDCLAFKLKHGDKYV